MEWIFRANFCLGIKVVLSTHLLNVWVPSAKRSPRAGSSPPPTHHHAKLLLKHDYREWGEEKCGEIAAHLSGLRMNYPLL